jgi:hypothetical protein
MPRKAWEYTSAQLSGSPSRWRSASQWTGGLRTSRNDDRAAGTAPRGPIPFFDGPLEFGEAAGTINISPIIAQRLEPDTPILPVH